MSAPRATALPSQPPTCRVSPGIRTLTAVWLMVRLSAMIFHLTSLLVVSTAAVSLRAILMRPSARRAPFTSTVSPSRSIPCDESHSSPSSPLICRSLISPSVLMRASCSDSSLTTTRFCSSGHSCTSATRWPTSARVSFCSGCVSPGLMARKPSMPRSRGNSRLTWPTVISIPVFSEAMAATCCTAQFCTGGQ